MKYFALIIVIGLVGMAGVYVATKNYYENAMKPLIAEVAVDKDLIASIRLNEQLYSACLVNTDVVSNVYKDLTTIKGYFQPSIDKIDAIQSK